MIRITILLALVGLLGGCGEKPAPVDYGSVSTKMEYWCDCEPWVRGWLKHLPYPSENVWMCFEAHITMPKPDKEAQ